MSSVSQVAITEKSQSEKQTFPRKSKFRQYLPMYLSIAPYFIIFLAFGLIPTGFSLYLAFQKWDGIGTMQFVGWQNFYFVLTDPTFGKSILSRITTRANNYQHKARKHQQLPYCVLHREYFPVDDIEQQANTDQY